MTKSISGNVVQILEKEIFYGIVTYNNDKIFSIEKIGEEKKGEPYILPGFIDSHVHIESSMLIPSEFARMAVVHGTIGTVSDPHEIANVCGVDGVKYMIENGKKVPFYFCFGAPSCVPATIFETAGASLNSQQVEELLNLPEIGYLSEVMNFPGVLNNDQELMLKIKAAKNANKPIDGHAPGLMGELAKQYIDAGIETDHECFTAHEAICKLGYGMKILIREGSAAKNFDALIDLLHDHENEMMFCSDDMHPDSLENGHINLLCSRAVKKGIDIFKVLKAACINPAKHYNFRSGILQKDDHSDFIVVNNLSDFLVLKTVINGETVAENGTSMIPSVDSSIINSFCCELKTEKDFELTFKNQETIPIIKALDGQLITEKIYAQPKVEAEKIIADQSRDFLKIAVVNRYQNAPVSVAFIHNFGIKNGAIASSVAHDSHNIVVIGSTDKLMSEAVNLIIENRGGISTVNKEEKKILPLPIAGLMSNDNAYTISKAYADLDNFAKVKLESTLSAPFMTLSFMALLVIPHIKLSDKGLFDGDQFVFIPS
jgi:adenine deaminase